MLQESEEREQELKREQEQVEQQFVEFMTIDTRPMQKLNFLEENLLRF